jgi:hypothetical protein
VCRPEGGRDGAALSVVGSIVIVDVDSGVAVALGSGEIVSLEDDREAVSLGEAEGGADGDALSDGEGFGEGERFGLSFFGVGLAFLWSFFCGVGDGRMKNLLIF